MMDTLKDHFRTKPDIHVCIDSFTHGMPFVNGKLDEELYEDRIKEIGYVVLVMSPWNNIRFFRRTALLFELYAAIKHGCKVEVAMSTVEKKILIDVVKKQGVQLIQQALELVDLGLSKSNSESVQVIKEKVKSDESYDDANLLIINVVRDCLMAAISKFCIKYPLAQETKNEDEDLLPEAEDKLHHLMTLWESDIDKIIPDVNSTNSIKITFKTALPLSYYSYMHKTKNAKSLLLCLKNTEYGGAWRITMIGISRKLVRCECTSGKTVGAKDNNGKVISIWQVDWELGETFKPKVITETAVMVNFKER
eukprot:gene61867-biopygen30843